MQEALNQSARLATASADSADTRFRDRFSAWAHWQAVRSAAQRGQATVEYVGLAVAVAVLLAAVGSGLSGQGGKLGKVVVAKITQAIDGGKS